MNKLPSIYKNNNINPKDNNKTKSIVKEENILDSIFSNSKPYDIKVIIKTKDKIIEDYLIDRTKDYIIPLNNEKININDIIDIQIKKA